jgi:chromosome segregation ATPase
MFKWLKCKKWNDWPMEESADYWGCVLFNEPNKQKNLEASTLVNEVAPTPEVKELRRECENEVKSNIEIIYCRLGALEERQNEFTFAYNKMHDSYLREVARISANALAATDELRASIADLSTGLAMAETVIEMLKKRANGFEHRISEFEDSRGDRVLEIMNLDTQMIKQGNALNSLHQRILKLETKLKTKVSKPKRGKA